MTQSQAADIEGSHVEAPTFVPPVNAPPAEPATPESRSDAFFTTEQLEKARAEERNKAQSEKARLKAKYDETQAELAELKAFKEEQERVRAAEAKKAAKAKRSDEEKDLSAKEILARRDAERDAERAEWEHRFAQLEAQGRLEREVMQLQVYIQRRIAEEQAAKSIAPQFIDYITGTSQEEVEASIELAKVKTAEILADIASTAKAQPRPQGVSVSTGPSNIGSQSETNADEVDYTSLSMKDYLEKVRPKMGIGGNGQGIFS
jgi:hypothetical protein